MAARIGRKVTFKWNGTAIPGVREKGITINGEPIDVTADDDAGLHAVLSEAAELGWEISISGLAKDDTLKIAAAALTDRVKAVTLEYTGGALISGDFYLSTYQEGEPYKEAATFSATLVSTGAVTYTPAP